MNPPEANSTSAVIANPFTASDVVSILSGKNWLTAEPSAAQLAWCERAAALLRPHAMDRAGLADLLGLLFHYDAREILERVESHAVLARYAARDVLRELALLLLEGRPLDSDRFKEIITALKERLEIRGRELFHPIRLALAGRSGEGELDRVILLLDEAAVLAFPSPVRSASERILEFCSGLD